MKKSSEKSIPKFKSEQEERVFWSKEASGEYVDWTKGERIILSELKPSVKTISLRLPESLLASLKMLANKRDVPYQSLMKVFLDERLRQELFKDSLLFIS